MTRALGETVIQDALGNVITGCTIDLLTPGTTSRIGVPVYADATSADTLSLPYVSASGAIVFYLAIGQLVTVQATKGGITGTETIAVTDPAAQGTSGALSGTADGDLSGTYPAPTLRAGAATGIALGADVLVTGAGAQTKTGTLQAPIQLPNGLRLWDGTGVPSNATGTDGDLYLRSDGAGTATLYQRVAGAWVLLTLPAGGTASGALTGTYPGPIGLAAGSATGAVLGTDVVNTGGGAQVKTGTLKTPLILPSGVRLWDGTGVPPNITGSNGDLYFRLDGAATQATPSVYQRVAGFWVALGQGGPPTGAATGSLAGNYPNPSFAASTATGAVLGADVLVIGAGAQTKTGILTAPITLPNGVHLWDGAGVPGAGLGSNGDLYLRSDGAATSTLYQKVSGAWVLIGQAAGSSVTVAEQDGSPSVSSVTTIKVNNGTLTDNTGGVVSLSTKYRYGPGFSTPQAGDVGPEGYADAATTSVQLVAKRTGGTGAVLDLQRNGVSILSAPLSLTTTAWLTATLSGSPNLALGDTLQVVVTSITGPVTLISTEYLGLQT